MVHGGPHDWFAGYGWRIVGTEHGSEWDDVTRVVLDAARGDNPDRVPTVGWFKTRKGRGYLKYDYASHGNAHAMNSEPFWQLRKEFMAKYGVEYEGVDTAAPKDAEAIRAQARRNLGVAAAVFNKRTDVVDYLTERLAEIAATVPESIPTFRLGGKGTGIFADERITDFERYPAAMWAKPRPQQGPKTSPPTAFLEAFPPWDT